MGTYGINKMSLSVFDEKRFVLNDGIHTLAYFYKDRFTQIIEISKDSHKKKRFSQIRKILIKRRDSHK